MNDKITPNCRYGHGDLIKVATMDAKPSSFGYVMLIDGSAPGSIVGMDFWLCKTCGYSEIFDTDVEKTIRMMGSLDV